MRILILLLVMLTTMVPGSAQERIEAVVTAPKSETTYDSAKDRTTVGMKRMQISGEKGKYHSLHMSPAYSFPGKTPRKPEIIDFELQTVVKARKLKIDLYVLFVIDGEEIFLSSNRRGVAKPVPGRSWVGERLVFRMPYETLRKIANAKQAIIRMDGIDFELSIDHRSALRAFAETAKHGNG